MADALKKGGGRTTAALQEMKEMMDENGTNRIVIDCKAGGIEVGAAVQGDYSVASNEAVAAAVQEWWTAGTVCRDGALGLFHCAGETIPGDDDAAATVAQYTSGKFESHDFTDENYEISVSVDGVQYLHTFRTNVKKITDLVTELDGDLRRVAEVSLNEKRDRIVIRSKTAGGGSSIVVKNNRITFPTKTVIQEDGCKEQVEVFPLGMFNGAGDTVNGQNNAHPTHGRFVSHRFVPCDLTSDPQTVNVVVDGANHHVVFDTNVEAIEDVVTILQSRIAKVATVSSTGTGSVVITSMSTGRDSMVVLDTDYGINNSILKTYGRDLNDPLMKHNPFFAGTARDVFVALGARLRGNLLQWIQQHDGPAAAGAQAIAEQLHLGVEYADALKAYRGLDIFVTCGGDFVSKLLVFPVVEGL